MEGIVYYHPNMDPDQYKTIIEALKYFPDTLKGKIIDRNIKNKLKKEGVEDLPIFQRGDLYIEGYENFLEIIKKLKRTCYKEGGKFFCPNFKLSKDEFIIKRFDPSEYMEFKQEVTSENLQLTREEINDKDQYEFYEKTLVVPLKNNINIKIETIEDEMALHNQLNL